MAFDYLVDYVNSTGEFRTYGGSGHMVDANNSTDAREKVLTNLPPQVAKTWTRIQVKGRYNG